MMINNILKHLRRKCQHNDTYTINLENKFNKKINHPSHLLLVLLQTHHSLFFQVNKAYKYFIAQNKKRL